MDNNDNLKENFTNINTNFEADIDMAKLKAELMQQFKNYKTTMKYMLADAPIGTLCLPAATEKLLLDQGFLRIYDLFDVDFVKIKGFGPIRVKQVTARLDQFFSMF